MACHLDSFLYCLIYFDALLELNTDYNNSNNNSDHINNKNTKYSVYLEALNVSQHCNPFLIKSV